MSLPGALVTGGSGFLGRRIVEALVDAGTYEVWIFDIQAPSPPVQGAKFMSGNLADYTSVEEACTGKQAVFHVATAAPTAQNAASAKALMQAVNVDGTTNIVKACQACKVSRLILTSSASVVFDGSPLVRVDETHPYADPPMDNYTSTKAQAEKIVLNAHLDSNLAVCALRPSAIFGPGDRLLVPSVVRRAKQKKMPIIGSGENLFDWTYVDNVVQAHVLADVALKEPASPARGQAFFITNDEPVPFWGMMGDICEGFGYTRPKMKLPTWLMMVVAVIAVWAGRIFGMQSDLNPMRIKLCTVERTFSCGKAKDILGYKPSVDMKTALERTIASFPELQNTQGKVTKKTE